MKKNYFPLIIVLFLCAALVFVSFLKEKNTDVVSNNNEVVNEEVKKEDSSASKNETSEEIFNQDNKNNEKKEETSKEISNEKKEDAEKKVQSGKGLFLGMDDSNFLVIFMNDENGAPKEYRFAIERSLNFENSDIEIGDSVAFDYTIDSKDTKTIVKISKAK